MLLILSGCKTGSDQHASGTDSLSATESDSAFLQQYSSTELRTNWSKHLISPDSVADGGVRKNDIPAIDFPQFVSVDEARRFLTGPDFGMLLDYNGARRFYPLSILNWHEIVNDEIAGVPVAVTFCPLCGSAIVYHRVAGSDTLKFGVSGRLYDSNLLMFDDKTESLWLQAKGECVIGDFTGLKLQLINSVLISFDEVIKAYPDARILSTDTGFDRNYFQYPYSDYNASDELYFPVSRSSNRFQNKDEMFVVKDGDITVAFRWLDLLKAGKARQPTPSGVVEVTVKDFVPAAINRSTGQKLNGYFSYWFSWYATYGTDGIVWNK
jgi:hypothetical protein